MTIAQEKASFLLQIGMGKAIPKRGYYVYAIIEDGVVCYIGKGKSNRVLIHFRGSSNQLLASRIRDNRSSFNWLVLGEFEDESECFDYEEKLIRNCKDLKHKLYNKVHYSSGARYNSLIRGFIQVFNQFERMVFRYEPNPNIASPGERAELLLSWVKETCSKMKQVPTYKGVPINQLSFIESVEFGKIRITIQ